jgi:AICAR transformylase/IMP cyclohydrolase PurH
LDELHENT